MKRVQFRAVCSDCIDGTSGWFEFRETAQQFAAGHAADHDHATLVQTRRRFGQAIGTGKVARAIKQAKENADSHPAGQRTYSGP